MPAKCRRDFSDAIQALEGKEANRDHTHTEEQLRAQRLLREEQTSLPRLEVPAQNLFI